MPRLSRPARALAVAGLLLLGGAAPAAGAISTISYDRELVDNSDEDNRIDDSGIWAKPAAGGEARRLVKGSVSLPDFAPDGSQLLYHASPEGLTVAGIDGSGARAIFDPVGIGGRMDLATNGQIVVAARATDPTPAGSEVNKLYAINAAGDGLRVLYEPAPVYDPGTGTYREYHLESPALSPDGARIAFSQTYHYSDVPGVSEGLHLINADGSGVTRLVQDGWGAAWSPDGTRIAFSRQGDLFLIAPDGSGLTNVTNTPDLDEGSPAFSPDGTRLAFDSSTFVSDGSTGPDSHIETIRIDGSGRTDLTGADPGTESDPSWANVAELPPPAGSASDGCEKARNRLAKARRKLKQLRRDDASRAKLARAKQKVKKAKRKAKACRP